MKRALLAVAIAALLWGCDSDREFTCDGGRIVFDRETPIGCMVMSKTWGVQYEGFLFSDPERYERGSRQRVRHVLLKWHGERPQ